MTPRIAYRLVRAALKKGALVRARYCERCGVPDRPGADGRSTIQGHHCAGYENPLTVEWLCVKCHRDETPLPEPVLTSEQVIEIRRRYANDPSLTNRALAEEFGLTRRHIGDIISGACWPNLPIFSQNRRRIRPVIRSDGKWYASAAAAGREIGTTSQMIANVCRGKGKTTHGYGWRYAEGENV